MNLPEENPTMASKRKRRLYLMLLIFQVLMIFYPMLLQELITQHRVPLTMAFLGITQTIIVLVLITTNSLFVKEFIADIGWFYLVVGLNITGFIVFSVSHVVPSVSGDPEFFRIFSLIGYCCVFISLCFTFYAATKDIFKLRHDLTYSLLGAANIFLLIGFLFSFIINISGLVFAGMVLPLDQMIGMDVYSSKLAFYALASMDPPFDNINPFIKNILVIESIFAHLFVVIIIGRLLSK